MDAVHAKGSYIYLQLWALGRKAKEEVLRRDGYDLVSASPNRLDDTHAVPRALSKDDIKRYISLYTQAAKNAVFKAGFDGVEVHSAKYVPNSPFFSDRVSNRGGDSGYLLDQFLQDVSNYRTDEYGGSIENRARFTLEVTDAVVNAVGAKKTGIRFSPWSTFNGKCIPYSFRV